MFLQIIRQQFGISSKAICRIRNYHNREIILIANNKKQHTRLLTMSCSNRVSLHKGGKGINNSGYWRKQG